MGGTITVKFGRTTIVDDPYSYSFEQDATAQEKTITVNGNNNTVSSLKDHINSNDYGVTASIVMTSPIRNLMRAYPLAKVMRSM